MLVGIHVAKRDQRAVLRIERGAIVGKRLHPPIVTDPREQVSQSRVARRIKMHPVDEVRELVAGVVALEMRRTVDVVIRIHQPVGIEHHQRINTRLATAPADFAMAGDRVLA
jgi:hypothetical protein